MVVNGNREYPTLTVPHLHPSRKNHIAILDHRLPLAKPVAQVDHQAAQHHTDEQARHAHLPILIAASSRDHKSQSITMMGSAGIVSISDKIIAFMLV